jgi:hypothetical protein
MALLPQSILQHALALPEGGVLSPREFLHLGSRTAVDQALSRLAKAGQLQRVLRGFYVVPVVGRFGVRSPAPDKVVQAMAAHSGQLVVPHGAAEANALGLTQQVPVREVYLTSGKTHRLQLGPTEVLVKHVPRWMLALGSGPAGAAVRALAWLGKAQVDQALVVLHAQLPAAQWQALAAARGALPPWMAQAIGKEAARG